MHWRFVDFYLHCKISSLVLKLVLRVTLIGLIIVPVPFKNAIKCTFMVLESKLLPIELLVSERHQLCRANGTVTTILFKVACHNHALKVHNSPIER